MSTREIYLDNAATTKPHPAVVEAMMRALSEYGNPSSLHHRGLAAERLVSASREAVARSLGVGADEIVFTSGGTESNNLAITGVASSRTGHLITAATEHSSVLEACRRLAALGFEITELPVDAEGRVNAAQVAAALRPATILVSIMAVNNEIGTRQPLEAIARAIHAPGAGHRRVLFHVDGVQAWGKIPLRPAAAGIDLLSVSGHKVHGPKGVGALYVRRGVQLWPLQRGGDQEHGVRPGTENVPGIVGLGAAATLLAADLDRAAARMAQLRDRLRERLADIADVRINTPADAAPHIVNATVPGVRGETLLHRLEQAGVFVSTGSACHAHDPQPSHVLVALGLRPEEAISSIRFSLGRETTAEDIDEAAAAVQAAVAELRSLVR